MSDPGPGDRLGRYRLEREIGRGGMGMVFLSRDELLDRSVAVKVLASSLADDEEFRRRFLREMRMAGALEHPNVVPVYDAGEAGRRLYLASRYIDGQDLRAAIRERGALPPERVAAIAAQLAAGLDAAHARGLVHRDVKPANVLLEQTPDGERVYLTDFGLAREAASDSGLTNTGQWMGTIDYAPPEQLEAGGLVSASSDIYSMGCLLFEALTGHVPYEGGLGRKVAGHTTEPLPSVGLGVCEHAAIDAVLARATAKRPQDRHPSAGDLGRALAAAVQGRPIAGTERTVATGNALTGLRVGSGAEDATARIPRARTPRPPRTAPADPAPVTQAPARPSRRGVALAGAVALIVLAIAAAGALVLSTGSDDPAGGNAAVAGAQDAATVERVSTVDRVTTVTVTEPSAATADAQAGDAEDGGDGGTRSAFATGAYVQLGSFRHRSDAQASATRLANAAGIDARVVASDDIAELVPGFSVVLVGPVDRAEGARVARAARDGGVDDGFVRTLHPDARSTGPADLAARTVTGDLRQISARTPSLNKEIPTTLTFSDDGRRATVSYGEPICSGTLTFQEAEGPVLRYREHITSGTCTEGGTWALRGGDGRIGGTWRHPGREYFVRGWLR